MARRPEIEDKPSVDLAEIDIAFFDLDKTVLSVNSATLWLKSEYRAGRVRRRDAARALVWLMRYSTGFVDLEAGLRVAIRSLAGLEEEVLDERVRAFFEKEVKHQVRPGAAAALAEHKAAGHACVLLTSASIYLSRNVSAQLHFDGILANRFEVNEGVFTGEPVLPICYGPGKLQLAQAFAKDR